MKSEDNAEVLLAYCARKLNGEAVATLESHMEICPECAAFRHSQQSVWEALDAWEAPPVSLDFDRRLYARIEAAEAAPWYRRWFESFRPAVWQPAFPLAAAAVLVAAGFILDHPPGATLNRQNAPHSVSVTEAEQAERTLDDINMLRQFDVPSPKEKSSKSM